MADQIDDISADPDRGILEPERASLEPLGSIEPPVRPGAPRRPATSARSPRAKDRPAAEASQLDRPPAGTLVAREPAAPDGDAMASGTQPIAPAGARPAVLRQGLPRVGAYRASAVTRSPH